MISMGGFKNYDALFVTNPYNIRYLSGFVGVNPQEREAYLLLVKKKRYLIASRLYEAEARRLEAPLVEIIITSPGNSVSDILSGLVKKLRIKRLGVEAASMTLAEFKWIKKKTPNIHFIETAGAIEQRRVIKNGEEIEKIEKAQRIAEESFSMLLRLIKPGMAEIAIAERLEAIMKIRGSERPSFETIVAFGKNAARPHYRTRSTGSRQVGTTKIKKGSMLLMDFGATYQGYCGDMSRTIFLGKPTARFLKIYNLVQQAQERTLQKCVARMRAHDIHTEAHELFERERVQDNFTHALGHGIGLEVHEAPHIRKDSRDILKPGMVFSVEPGLYFPGWGGVRIEDLVALRPYRADVLRKKKPSLISLFH